MLGIETHLKKAQLWWCEHVARMEDYRLPNQLFFAELSQAKRHLGSQTKRYKDTLKASLKAFSVPTNRWQNAALNRATWRATINKGTTVFERDRLQSLDEKRMAKKNSHQPRSFFCNLPQMRQTLRIPTWSLSSHVHSSALTIIFDNEGPLLQ